MRHNYININAGIVIINTSRNGANTLSFKICLENPFPHSFIYKAYLETATILVLAI